MKSVSLMPHIHLKMAHFSKLSDLSVFTSSASVYLYKYMCAVGEYVNILIAP